MAPTNKKTPDNPHGWWQDAWKGNPDMEVSYSFPLGKDMLEVSEIKNTAFKLKNRQDIYKFRCHVTNTRTGKSWIEAIDVNRQSFKSVRVEAIKGIIKPKRTRRKRTAKP